MSITPKTNQVLKDGAPFCDIFYWERKDYGKNVLIDQFATTEKKTERIEGPIVYLVVPEIPVLARMEEEYILELPEATVAAVTIGGSMHLSFTEEPGHCFMLFRATKEEKNRLTRRQSQRPRSVFFRRHGDERKLGVSCGVVAHLGR